MFRNFPSHREIIRGEELDSLAYGKNVPSSLSGRPLHFKRSTSSLIPDQEQEMGIAAQSTTVITMHFMA